MSGSYIVWLDENPASLDPSIVGGKNANSAKLLFVGVRIPYGFVVSTEAYKRFAEGLQERIGEMVSGVDFDDAGGLEEASEKIREVIKTAELPREIDSSIRSAYRVLCAKHNDNNLPVAVRSSATAECMPTTSLAGQHETYLWVRGEDNVVQRVVDCWASLYTARAMSYKNRAGIDHAGTWMAVGVQRMVKARSSGVMFTLNPSNGDPSKIVIESSWGLGEAVVSGQVTPDNFIVDKVTFEILNARIHRKHRECVVEDGRVTYRDVPEDRQEKPSITNDEILELAKIGKKIERHHGVPQDIEWAIDGTLHFPENIFIVQSRPETVWSGKRKPVVDKAKSGLDLVVDKLVGGVRTDQPS